MRYIFTFFWVILLANMVNYVVGSMVEAPYSFKLATLIGIFISMFIFIISEVAEPNTEQAK